MIEDPRDRRDGRDDRDDDATTTVRDGSRDAAAPLLLALLALRSRGDRGDATIERRYWTTAPPRGRRGSARLPWVWIRRRMPGGRFWRTCRWTILPRCDCRSVRRRIGRLRQSQSQSRWSRPRWRFLRRRRYSTRLRRRRRRRRRRLRHLTWRRDCDFYRPFRRHRRHYRRWHDSHSALSTKRARPERRGVVETLDRIRRRKNAMPVLDGAFVHRRKNSLCVFVADLLNLIDW
mmetsp:Transcript_41779/g.87678  ORF Transcript_41779/g.87678 Transcript_41779/m.87678 type:complete len:233 (-) Transcript_41779:109-807(-)